MTSAGSLLASDRSVCNLGELDIALLGELLSRANASSAESPCLAAMRMPGLARCQRGIASPHPTASPGGLPSGEESALCIAAPSCAANAWECRILSSPGLRQFYAVLMDARPSPGDDYASEPSEVATAYRVTLWEQPSRPPDID